MPTITTSKSNDAIKGGVFFGSNLTPGGLFSNIPESTNIVSNQTVISPNIILTLEQIKNSLNNSLSSTNSLSNPTLNIFLKKYTQLLIDYEEIRNTVFFGSSYTELSYQITYLSSKYPYKIYIAKKGTTNTLKKIELNSIGANSSFYFKINEDMPLYNNVDITNDGAFSWIKDYDIIDSTKTRFPVKDLQAIKTGVLGEVTPFKSTDSFSYYILEIKANLTLKEEGSVIFFDSLKMQSKLGEAQIINGDGYPFYLNDSVYLKVKFVNLSDKLKDLEILKRDAVGVFSSTAITFKVDSFNSSSPSLCSITIIKSSEDGTSINGFPSDIDLVAGDYLTIVKDLSPEYKIYEKVKIDSITIGDTMIVNFTPDPLLNIDYNQIDTSEGVYVTLPETLAKIQVSGRIEATDEIQYNAGIELNVQTIHRGLLLSPKLGKIIEFESTLDGLQKAILNILNPTPWPREVITNNIITEGEEFRLWVQNPDNMIKNKTDFDFSYYTDNEQQYDLVGAISLDENETNQLIRRAIPSELINEINETDDSLFSRYVLLAAKFFDSIKVYIDFIQYTHTLNYSEFNQLSPEFYKLYADHHGLTLFSEGNESDLSSLIFDTVNTRSSLYVENSNLIDSVKLNELAQKRQKYLLINLLYIYSKKGTIACLESLLNLLGTPDGLVSISEYEYLWDKVNNFGYKNINNEKVSVPQVLSYDKDVDKSVNKPYYYKPVYDNDNVYNLRELTLQIDPIEGITKDIYKYIQKKKQYAYFNPGSFLNLQPIECPKAESDEKTSYYGLPLSFPEKFSGIGVNYLIDKTSPDDLKFAKFQICGLYKLSSSSVTFTEDVVNPINTLFTYQIPLLKDLPVEEIYKKNSIFALNHYPIVLKITIPDNFSSITTWNVKCLNSPSNDFTLQLPSLYDIESIEEKLKQFKILFDNKTNVFSSWIEDNKTSEIGKYDFCIKYNYDNFLQSTSIESINCSLDVYNNNVLSQSYNFSKGKKIKPAEEYIIANVEGKDLIVRLRLKNANNGKKYDRIVICEDVFTNDGLIHNLKLTYRLEGVEVFVDYKFFKFVNWQEFTFSENIKVANTQGSVYYPKSLLSGNFKGEWDATLNNPNLDANFNSYKVGDYWIVKNENSSSSLDKLNGWKENDLALKTKTGWVRKRISSLPVEILNRQLDQQTPDWQADSGVYPFIVDDSKIQPGVFWKTTEVNDVYNNILKLNITAGSYVYKSSSSEWGQTYDLQVLESKIYQGEWFTKENELPTPIDFSWKIDTKGTLDSINWKSGNLIVKTQEGWIQVNEQQYSLKWWDMFVGMPANIDMNINKVSVFEKLYINQPDFEDSNLSNNLNHELEKWWFDFSNQEKNISGNYVTDKINIFANYNGSTPSLNNFLDTLKINDFFKESYSVIKLSNVDRTNVEILSQVIGNTPDVEYIKLNSYFNPSFVEKKLNSSDAVVYKEFVKNMIKQTGWTNSIHQDYNYEGFNEIINNYYKFSEKVLDYSTLLAYSQNVKPKFEGIVKQFIPIVINITEFNILYRFFTSKHRYQKSFYLSNIGTYLNSPAFSHFKILKCESGVTYEISLVNKITDVNISPTTYFIFSNSESVQWLGTAITNKINGEATSNYLTAKKQNDIIYFYIDTQNFKDIFNLQTFQIFLLTVKNLKLEIKT